MNSNMLRMALLLVSSFGHAACSAEEVTSNKTAANAQHRPVPREEAMQIRIKTDQTALTARLEDSAAARDFAAMLPLNLTLKDYASTEKVADLPRKLSTDGAPDGIDPEPGDIAYYAPWGNLALYYRDFGYSRGLVRLGRIETGAEQLRSLEGTVTIEAAN